MKVGKKGTCESLNGGRGRRNDIFIFIISKMKELKINK